MGCGSSTPAEGKTSKTKISAKVIPLRQFDGILTVKIHGCRNLPAMDRTTGKADPFVTLSYGDQTFKTGTVMRNQNPTFDQHCRLFIKKGEVDYRVRISAYDKDYSKKNDFIGNVEITTNHYIKDGGTTTGKWYKFLPKSARRINSSTTGGEQQEEEPMSGVVDTEGLMAEHERLQGISDGKLGEVQLSISYQDAREIEKEFWQSWFSAVDADNDNMLSENEFKEFVNQVGGREVPLAKLRELFNAADANNDQKVTVEELSIFMSKPENAELVDDTTVYHFALERGRMGDEDKEMEDGYVTESEAAKGWVFKMSEWVGGDQYDIGVNTGSKAKHILVKERNTGILKEEVISPNINLAMRAMYQSSIGSKAVSLGQTHALLKKVSDDQGRKYNNPKSAKEIPKFIERFHLNVNEVLDPIDSFKTYNEFFFRKLKPEARPIDKPTDPKGLVSPADCRIMVFNDVETSKKLWIKGRDFSIKKLIGEANSDYFEGGGIVVCRLAPQDYHRYHVPCGGTLETPVEHDGTYYTVNPVAVNSMDVFTENKRTLTVIDSKEFGKVGYVNVGATLVGSIVMTKAAGDVVVKGDELGYFAFGGSTVILCFEKGRVKFDQDLVDNSMKALETQVFMGNSLGVAADV